MCHPAKHNSRLFCPAGIGSKALVAIGQLSVLTSLQLMSMRAAVLSGPPGITALREMPQLELLCVQVRVCGQKMRCADDYCTVYVYHMCRACSPLLASLAFGADTVGAAGDDCPEGEATAGAAVCAGEGV
jgi:hypothetical protein